MNKNKIALIGGVIILVAIGGLYYRSYQNQIKAQSQQKAEKLAMTAAGIDNCEPSADIAKVSARKDLNPGVVKSYKGQSYICPIDTSSKTTTSTQATPAPTASTDDEAAILSQEVLKDFKYDKGNVETYTDKAKGFSFDYPKGWTAQANAKLDKGSAFNNDYAVLLSNTKDYPLRKNPRILVLISPRNEWILGGGEGSSEIYSKLINAKTGQPMYMTVSLEWGIGDFYDAKHTEEYLKAYYAEGDKENQAFYTVAKSLKAN
jgi:hypothetical protein